METRTQECLLPWPIASHRDLLVTIEFVPTFLVRAIVELPISLTPLLAILKSGLADDVLHVWLASYGDKTELFFSSPVR